MLTFIVDTTNVDEWSTVLIIDHERSDGYSNVSVSLREDTVTYDTKEDVQKLLQAGKPLELYHCEEMPEYPGGIGKCTQYLMTEAVRVMKERNIFIGYDGLGNRAIIRFIIDEEGNVTSPVVVREVDPVLDKIGLEVVQSMPKWKPGKIEGKVVPCLCAVLVSYRLR